MDGRLTGLIGSRDGEGGRLVVVVPGNGRMVQKLSRFDQIFENFHLGANSGHEILVAQAVGLGEDCEGLQAVRESRDGRQGAVFCGRYHPDNGKGVPEHNADDPAPLQTTGLEEHLQQVPQLHLSMRRGLWRGLQRGIGRPRKQVSGGIAPVQGAPVQAGSVSPVHAAAAAHHAGEVVGGVGDEDRLAGEITDVRQGVSGAKVGGHHSSQVLGSHCGLGVPCPGSLT